MAVIPLQLVYLPLLLLALRQPSRRVALACSALLALAGLLLWLRTLAQGRAVRDTPRARIRSAAQGYVELHGVLKPLGGAALTLPGSGLPCVWYRVQVQERSGDEWRTVAHLDSQESLLLRDDSGECLVLWEGAQIVGSRSALWEDQGQRFQQRWLAVDQPVTVLGFLRTRGGSEGAPTVAEETADLLARWKSDRASLLRRFDRNGDGEIDLDEWEDARQAARAQILLERADTPDRGETHLIQRPEDGRPFIISALPGGGLRRRLALIAVVDATAFLGGLWWLGRLLHGAGAPAPW